MRPTTRWAGERGERGAADYVARMRALAAEGADLDGEARLVDVLVPRAARVLDAGCGTGRVGAALARRGHAVVGVDADPVLVAAARADHPGPAWHTGDLADLGAAALDLGPFDAVVAAGNVLVYVAAGTEAAVVAALAGVLRPGGVLVTGFATGRHYGPDDLDADAAAAGLVAEHRFATWDLHPWHEDADWVVGVHRRPAAPATAG
ncbi:MAG TPA: methyltransferase domain-containing protein [Acidimicrobiales bacterium]|nr:methyltransferase domain-containing protein [Acidimicrobiales bacterium]